MKKLNNKTKFLLLVVIGYLGVAFFNFDYAFKALNNTLEITLKIIPILIIVIAVMTLMEFYLNSKFVEKNLSQKSGLRGYFWAILSGILISGPPYILFPMLKQLKNKGMSDKFIAIFLYNRNVKIPFFPALIYYFGWQYSLVLSFYIILLSIPCGLLVEFFSNQKRIGP
ncbi:MAG: hypothetical protein GF335_04190 [Candidatus Moranbacteria bacterium]|nr:hypothetical protein [Candidatus Moranbacteria bacterium]